MQKLKREDLLSLEQYSEERPAFRARIMAHKKNRIVPVGPHATIHFEDRLIMHYQVQEMLRAERIFEAAGIQEELDTYNPLIPDGSNLKATFMLEYPDLEERRQALAGLMGVEYRVWVRIAGFDAVRPIADEDLERESAEKTSSVHFLRFEFTPEMIMAAKEGAAISVGIDHEEYNYSIDPLPQVIRDSLTGDFA